MSVKAIEQGIADYEDGKSEFENPYARDTQDWRDWFAGWDAAQLEELEEMELVNQDGR